MINNEFVDISQQTHQQTNMAKYTFYIQYIYVYREIDN